MRIEQIAAHEQRFENSGRDSGNVQHKMHNISVEMPNGTKAEYTDAARSDNNEGYFTRTRTEKDKIVLHYTAGILKGDIQALTNPNKKVSVSFVIGRNGIVYNLFHPDFWSSHLGRGARGGNPEGSRSSIGIELSNVGPLERKGDTLHSLFGEYCDINQTEHYHEVSYRGFDFYASYTDAQYHALVQLMIFLTDHYSIPRTFVPEDRRFELFTTEEARAFTGIATHANYQPGGINPDTGTFFGKADIGPAFDWERVVTQLQHTGELVPAL